MIKKVLLLNLPGFEHAVSSVSINLGIATIAAVLKEKGNEVKILDLNLYESPFQKLKTELNCMKPQFVGFGVCTPQVLIAKKITEIIKNIDKNICVICGGPHPSALPIETLKEIMVDIVSIGEGDYTIANIINKYPDEIEYTKGICFRRQGDIIKNNRDKLINDLNTLPFPALELFEVEKYIYPLQSCRRNPVGLIETSRGCPGKCIFCSRTIVGGVCRFKSPERVVNEFAYAKKIGFKEIHFADDNFVTDINRAITICNLLIENKIDIPWVPRSGIRVDYVDEILFRNMREAGCYHLPFGIESVSQKVLNVCNKGISAEQIRTAVKIAKFYDFETTGYFMVGLPGQTVEDIKKDIDFIEEIELDFVKFGAAMPYPGTQLYNMLKHEGRLLTCEWSKYHYATDPFEIYEHSELSRDDFFKINIGGHALNDVLNCVLDKNLHPIIEPEQNISK